MHIHIQSGISLVAWCAALILELVRDVWRWCLLVQMVLVHGRRPVACGTRLGIRAWCVAVVLALVRGSVWCVVRGTSPRYPRPFAPASWTPERLSSVKRGLSSVKRGLSSLQYPRPWAPASWTPERLMLSALAPCRVTCVCVCVCACTTFHTTTAPGATTDSTLLSTGSNWAQGHVQQQRIRTIWPCIRGSRVLQREGREALGWF